MKLRSALLALVSFAGFSANLQADPAPTPIVVPLINFNNSGQLGIYVRVGTNPTPWTYILDTGSFAFATAKGHTSDWDHFDTTDTGATFSISYGDGSLTYSGNVELADITLSNSSGDALYTVANATLGVITNQPYANWDSDINSHPPIPPESPTTQQFYGTFGAGLDKTASGMSSVLGQIATPGLTQGWMIHTGGISSTTPTLTIGLTQAEMDSFPIKLPMNPSTGTFLTSTNLTINLYPESQVFANYTFTNGSDVYNHTGNMVIDSGGLGTHYFANTTISSNISDGSELITGTNFSAAVDGLTANTSLDWNFLAGTTDYVNHVGIVSGNDVLNTGVAIYYQYDIYFDIEHGVVGLRPLAVPEPATSALFAGGGILAVALLVRRRRRG